MKEEWESGHFLRDRQLKVGSRQDTGNFERKGVNMTDGKTDATDDSVSMNGAFTENVRTRSVIAQLREAVCKMHRREEDRKSVV